MNTITGIICEVPGAGSAPAILRRLTTAALAVSTDGFALSLPGSPTTVIGPETLPFTFAVSGTGLFRERGRVRILAADDWAERLAPDEPRLGDLNGHYIAVRRRGNRTELFSDRAGLRTVYIGRTEYGWIFSSRLDVVCRDVPDAGIDWRTFGSRWLLLQQCSHRSPVRGAVKLPPNGRFRVENGSLTVTSSPWMKFDGVTDAETVAGTIAAFTAPMDRTVSLGLSGGLDSRVLLSVALSSKVPFAVHSFGERTDADVALAERIAAREGVPFNHLQQPFPSRDRCVALMQEYVRTSNLVDGAASSVRLDQYPLIIGGAVMLDGGNGEILRRQFLQRAAVTASDDLRHRRTERLFPAFTLRRADIFSGPFLREMRSGAEEDLHASLHSLPPPDEIGLADFLDGWSALFRIPVVACDEQGRLDGILTNYMPFSQPDLLQLAVRLPERERRNNRLMKRIIREHRPSLARFPLVKNGVRYPYRLTTLQARAWSALARRFAHSADPFLHRFLDAVKEFALDTLGSAATARYDAYDLAAVRRAVEGYYRSERRYGGTVNWWLAFEVWRQGIENEKAGH